LRNNDLHYLLRWNDVDVNDVFFKVLAQHNIRHSFQQLLTEKNIDLLTKAERMIYERWLHGSSFTSHFGFSRTTACKHRGNIFGKTGVDIGGDRRPEALPKVNLAELLTAENIVPLPSWALESPLYWPPRAQQA
jgi:hypothetical protein